MIGKIDFRKHFNKNKNLTEEERFWQKVEKGEGCWEWLASINDNGYGMCNFEGFSLAHRFSYLIANGEFDTDLEVCHHCDNPKCVRPDHLFLGTHQDNMDDMFRKGRYKMNITPECYSRGSEVFGAKLTDNKVLKLRRLRKKGCGVTRMAVWMGMHRTSMQDLLHGRTWAHVAMP